MSNKRNDNVKKCTLRVIYVVKEPEDETTK